MSVTYAAAVFRCDFGPCEALQVIGAERYGPGIEAAIPKGWLSLREALEDDGKVKERRLTFCSQLHLRSHLDADLPF